MSRTTFRGARDLVIDGLVGLEVRYGIFGGGRLACTGVETGESSYECVSA